MDFLPKNFLPNFLHGMNVDYEPGVSGAMQLMAAQAASRVDGKAVLVDFGADWCAACQALDRAMRTPSVQAVLERSYHVVQLDLSSTESPNMRIANQYDATGTFGMPLLVVLGPDGSVRADSARVGQPRYDEVSLSSWLRRWAPR